MRRYIRRELEVVRALRIQTAIVMRLVRLKNGIDAAFAAPQLVAQRHHDERRMIAVSLQHGEALADQIILFGRIMLLVGLIRDGAPEREFRLHVDAEHVGGDEGGLRRAARMEAVMVDPVGSGDAENAQPLLHGGRREPGQWENQPVMLAPQKGADAVDGEFVPVRRELPQPDDRLARVQRLSFRVLQADGHPIEIRLRIAPQPGFLSEVESNGYVARAGVEVGQRVFPLPHGMLVAVKARRRDGEEAPAASDPPDSNDGRPVRCVRINLHVPQVRLAGELQLDPARNPVPVGLGIRRR